MVPKSLGCLGCLEHGVLCKLEKGTPGGRIQTCSTMDV